MKYHQAKYFIDVAPAKEENIRSAIAHQKRALDEWRQFKPSPEEHRALLRELNF